MCRSTLILNLVLLSVVWGCAAPPQKPAAGPRTAPTPEIRPDVGVTAADPRSAGVEAAGLKSTNVDAAAQGGDPRLEALVRAWVDTLNRHDLEAHRALFAPRFSCVHDDRTMSTARCLKRKQSLFGPQVEVALVEVEQLDFGKGGHRSIVAYEASQTPAGEVLTFSINTSDHKVQRFARCALTLARTPGRRLIVQETMELIDEERLEEPPARSDCRPPRGTPRHCVLLETRSREPRLLAALAARLEREGYTADAEGNTLAVFLTARELKRLFGARFVYRWVERSARPGTICNAYIEDARVPRRYRTDILSLGVGHQICE